MLLFLIAYATIYPRPNGLALNRKLLLAKLITSIGNCLSTLFGLVYSLFGSNILKEINDLQIGRAIDLVFAVLALLAYFVCVRRGIQSSGFLHLLWLVKLISLLPQTIFAINWFVWFCFYLRVRF